MKTRILLSIGATVVVVVALILSFGENEPSINETANAPSPPASVSANPSSDSSAQSDAPAKVPLSDPSETDNAENGPAFRVDGKGNLIVDEKARLKIEELIALTPPDKLYGSIRELTKDLPPSAARRAEELVDRVIHYQSAQRQSYPPGQAPLTEEDALTQLDGLHALRVAHFGPEVAAGFYDDEEKLSRELVELMRLEKDQSLTLPEKAERAQALRDRLPKVAAIENKNRDAAKKSGD